MNIFIWLVVIIPFSFSLIFMLVVWLGSKQQKRPRVIYVHLEQNGKQYRFVGKDIHGEILMDEKGKEILLTEYFEPNV